MWQQKENNNAALSCDKWPFHRAVLQVIIKGALRISITSISKERQICHGDAYVQGMWRSDVSCTMQVEFWQ